MKILVTGAGGFLGQRIVVKALEQGYRIVAVVRPGSEVRSLPWAGKANVIPAEIELSNSLAPSQLAEALVDVDVVIHAAGGLNGNDAEHLSGTIVPTRNLVSAMNMAATRRLVLISSLSVYGYAALPDGAQLDETTPTENDLADRDAYCRAKLVQEGIVLEAAQLRGLRVTTLRPGAIYGPGRLWTARLGFRFGPLAFLLGGQAAVPLIHVDHCALAAVLAIERDVSASDVYSQPSSSGAIGAFEAINAIDDDPPTQRQFAALLKQHSAGKPITFIGLPWGVLRRLASGFALLGAITPTAVARLPQIFRMASLCARAKPLRFSNCRLHDRLGWSPSSDLEQAIANSVKKH